MNDVQATIQAVLAGDRDRFRLLVERYQRPVFCLLQNLLPDRHLCEDVAQETFLAAYNSLRTYDPARARFSTWLLTIARNRSINLLNSRRTESVELPQEPIDGERPEDRMVQRELWQRLDEALGRLPQQQRTVFVLGMIMELPYDQIARIEGVGLGTVKSRMHRARKKLGEILAGLSELR
jgi:RNA polymerase sigma-70 factor (ECF subfamily)